MKDELKVIYKPEEIARRVREVGRQISQDFKGETLDVVAVLDNAYVFMADLVRALEVPVRTHFIRAEMEDVLDPNTGKERKEISFTPEVEASDGNVVVVEGVLQSGITTDFLLRRIGLHNPRVVKTAVCIDKPSERRVLLEPDYALFNLASNEIVVGYGLAWNGLHSNLPFIGAVERPAAKAESRAGRKGKGKGKRK
ncbi:MAG: phosphoribosyltransferase [Candidatus Acidiferrales bacterium]